MKRQTEREKLNRLTIETLYQVLTQAKEELGCQGK
jgi:hypothetical protein